MECSDLLRHWTVSNDIEKYIKYWKIVRKLWRKNLENVMILKIPGIWKGLSFFIDISILIIKLQSISHPGSNGIIPFILQNQSNSNIFHLD